MQQTEKIAAILVYLTKGSDQNCFVLEHQYGALTSHIIQSLWHDISVQCNSIANTSKFT